MDSGRILLQGKVLEGLHGEGLTVATAALLMTDKVAVPAKKDLIMETEGTIIVNQGEPAEDTTTQALKGGEESPLVENQDGMLFMMKILKGADKTAEVLGMDLVIVEILEDVIKMWTTEDTIEGTACHSIVEIQEGVNLKATEILGVSLTELSMTLEELKETKRETTTRTYKSAADRCLIIITSFFLLLDLQSLGI